MGANKVYIWVLALSTLLKIGTFFVKVLDISTPVVLKFDIWTEAALGC